MPDITSLKLSMKLPEIPKLLFSSSVSIAMLLVLLARPALAQVTGSSIWSIVASPEGSNADLSNNYLYGVSALSDSDVWAVGKFNTLSGGVIDQTLSEHWNGSAWSVVSTPNVGSLGSELLAVSAVADNNVWAVGDFSTSNDVSGRRTLIEHFDGSKWLVVPSPSPSQQGDFLTGVTALAANNVWAVGWFVPGGLAPLILHWNGTAWSVVTNGVPSDGILHSITALSPNDIWAVGESGAGPTNFEMHWNGVQWSVAPSASFPSGGQESLRGVSAASSNDVWAVGSYAPTIFAELQTLAVHWDGKQWSKVTTPDVDAFFNLLFSVAVVKSNDAWAVGYAYTVNGLNFHTLIEHWNGSQWSIVPSPNVSGKVGRADELDGVTLSGATTLWSVGTFIRNGHTHAGLRTLVVHTAQG